MPYEDPEEQQERYYDFDAIIEIEALQADMEQQECCERKQPGRETLVPDRRQQAV